MLCMDEKSQIQALARSAPILPMLPWTPAPAHEYERNDTSRPYAALKETSGMVISALHPRHRAGEFEKFLRQIDGAVPAELAVHLVLDNSWTHKRPEIKPWLLAHSRFVLHLTPTSRSWLNLVDRWFSEPPGTTTPNPTSGSAAARGDRSPAVKTGDQILESIARSCTRVNDSGH